MTDHRDTVVVRDGSSAGWVVGLLIVIVLLAGAWFFLLGPGSGSKAGSPDVNVNVELPSLQPAAS